MEQVLVSFNTHFGNTFIPYFIGYTIILIHLAIITFLFISNAKYKKILHELEKSENKYRKMFQCMQEGIALFSIVRRQEGEPENYCLIDTNPAFDKIFENSLERAGSYTVYDMLSQNERDKIQKLNEVAVTGEPAKYESYMDRLGKHLSINIYKPEEDKLVVIFTDVTQEKKAEDMVLRQKLSLEALFKNSSDAIVRFDQDHKVIDINERFTDLFGYTIDDVQGKEVDGVVATGEMLKEANQLTLDLLNGNVVSVESMRYGADGKAREVSVKGVAIMLNSRIIGGYGIYSDISQRKAAEKEILYMNYHDQLTGLYNRRFFEEELRRLDIERNLPISLIMADVNGLKLINDAFGHSFGDELLIKTGEIIRKECREDEIIARLGGDEFVILLSGTSSEEAERIIRRIKKASAGIQLQSMELSISFGWETKSSFIQDINEVLKNAEDYMYRHKLFESPSIRGKTVNAIINSLHEKNKREEQHSQRVSYLCEAIGIAMDKSESELKELKTVGLLHDIGKIAIDEKILNKPDKLTNDEWNDIKRHPEIGYRILSSVNDMAELAEFVLAHHERWDGKGYPKGLKGEEIPLQARIITVADTYDAMTSERAYRGAIDEDIAIDEIRRNAGTQFDPEVVRAFTEKVISSRNKVENREQMN